MNLAVLVENIRGLSNLLNNRTAMMKMMYRQDVRQDFLMKEKLQELDDTGGVQVQPIASPGVDLSPVNDLVPNVVQKKESSGDLVKAQTGLLGGADVSGALNISATSLGSEPMGDNPKGQDLEESGITGTIEKNPVKQIEDDFGVDEKMKKALAEAMALPVKAAAVSLVDLMSKIPPAGEASATAITRNIESVTKSFKLAPVNYEFGEDANKMDDGDASGEDGDKGYDTFLEQLVALGVNAAGGAGIVDMSGNKSAGGQIVPSQGDPIVGTGNRPPYTGTADGIGLGDGSGRAMQPVKKRKPNLKSALAMTPLGMSFMAGKKVLEGAKSFSKTQAFSNITNVGKKAFNMTPMGMMANMGMKGFGAISNIFNSNGDKKTDINELTNNVIEGNREKRDAATEIDGGELAAKMSEIPTMMPPPIGGEKSDGGGLTIPKIIESPYFVEYNKTSQF